MAAAFNAYLAEQYAPYGDRLIPVACIPTFTPEEALADSSTPWSSSAFVLVMMGGHPPSDSRGWSIGDLIWITLATGLSTITTRFGVGVPSFGVSRPSIRPARDGARVCRQANFVYNHIGTSLPLVN